jgi:hypothetical protein
VFLKCGQLLFNVWLIHQDRDGKIKGDSAAPLYFSNEEKFRPILSFYIMCNSFLQNQFIK